MFKPHTLESIFNKSFSLDDAIVIGVIILSYILASIKIGLSLIKSNRKRTEPIIGPFIKGALF